MKSLRWKRSWRREENRETHLHDLTYPLNLYVAKENTKTSGSHTEGQKTWWNRRHGGWRWNIHRYHWLQMDGSRFQNTWWICPEKNILCKTCSLISKRSWAMWPKTHADKQSCLLISPHLPLSSNRAGAMITALVQLVPGSEFRYWHPLLTPVVKVGGAGGAASWPVTQILKQGPAVALASVSSNLPVPQRRSALTG